MPCRSGDPKHVMAGATALEGWRGEGGGGERPPGVARVGEKPLNRAKPAPRSSWTEVPDAPPSRFPPARPLKRPSATAAPSSTATWPSSSGTTGYDYTTMTMPTGCHEPVTELLQDHRGRAERRRLRDGRHRPRDLLHHRRQGRGCPFAVCGEVLGDIRPAATLLIVVGLCKPEMKVEIEVTAKLPHRLIPATQTSIFPETRS